MKYKLVIPLIFLFLLATAVYAADYGATQVTVTKTSGTAGGRTQITIVDEPVIEYEIDAFTFTVRKIPATTEKTIKVKNIGDIDFVGDVIIEGNIKKFITAEICDLNGICKTEDITISRGETHFLKLKGNFDEDFKIEEGIVKMTHKIAEGETRVYELPIGVDRFPTVGLGIAVQNFLNVSEDKAPIITFGLLFIGLIIFGLIILRIF